MIHGFRKFIAQPALLVFAVAIILGGKVKELVDALIDFIVNPIISAIFGEPDLSGFLRIDVGDSTIQIGSFLNVVLQFVVLAAAIYFLIVVPAKKFFDRFGVDPFPEPGPTDNDLLAEIRDLLRSQQN